MISRTRAILAFLAAFGAGACSLITGGDSVQCATTSDCEARGVGGVCIEGICGGPSATILDPGQSQALTCAGTDECITANGGQAAVCRSPGQGQCLKLANEYCTVDGDYKNPNAIFLGLIKQDENPSGALALLSQPNSRLLQLAHSEAVARLPSGGLPYGVNGARRPIVLVTCELGDLAPSRMQAVAQHLLVDIGTPAVFHISTRPGMDFWAESVRLQKQVFLAGFALGDMRTALAGTGDTSTVFNIVPPVRRSIPAIGARFSQEVEPQIRALPNFEGGDVRLTTITTSAHLEPDMPILSAQFSDMLTVNGQPAKSQIPGTGSGAYDIVSYGNESGDFFAEAAQEVATSHPHALALAGDVELYRVMLPLIEAMWPAGHPRPTYLATLPDASIAPFIGGNEDTRRRIFGGISIDLTAGDAVRDYEVITHFQQRYPGVDVPARALYDFYYYVILGIAAAREVPNGQPTAFDVLRGVKLLKGGPGTHFFTGGGDLQNALAAINANSSIELSGVQNSLLFDFTLGDSVVTKIPLWCISRNPEFGLSSVLPGKMYDSTTQTLSGAWGCP